MLVLTEFKPATNIRLDTMADHKFENKDCPSRYPEHEFQVRDQEGIYSSTEDFQAESQA